MRDPVCSRNQALLSALSRFTESLGTRLGFPPTNSRYSIPHTCLRKCSYSLCYFHHYAYRFSLYLVHDILQNSVLFFLSSYPLTLILLKAPLTIFISNYSLAFCNRPPTFVLQEHVRYRPATLLWMPFIVNMPFVCHLCHYSDYILDC